MTFDTPDQVAADVELLRASIATLRASMADCQRLAAHYEAEADRIEAEADETARLGVAFELRVGGVEESAAADYHRRLRGACMQEAADLRHRAEQKREELRVHRDLLDLLLRTGDRIHAGVGAAEALPARELRPLVGRARRCLHESHAWQRRYHSHRFRRARAPRALNLPRRPSCEARPREHRAARRANPTRAGPDDDDPHEHHSADAGGWR